jgi:hypothetical protein
MISSPCKRASRRVKPSAMDDGAEGGSHTDLVVVVVVVVPAAELVVVAAAIGDVGRLVATLAGAVVAATERLR